MESKFTWARRWKGGGTGAAWAVVLGLVCLFYGEVLSNLSYDLPYLVRPYVPVGGDVVIIYMDERSHQLLQQNRWQHWDRTLHAQLLDKLKSWGSKTVVFDILFYPTTNSPPSADAALVQAVVAHGRVVVAAKLAPRLHEGEIISEFVLTPPFAQLETNVAGWGLVEVGGPDAAVRLHYRDTVHDIPVPTLAWRAAELSLPAPPTDPLLQRWVNYYGPPGWIPWRSYVEVLQSTDHLSPLFSNKIVFVGAQYDAGFTGGKGTDDFRTPYTRRTGRKSPGVEINATTYLNLARKDWLSRLPPLSEVGLILMLGLAAGFGLTRLRPVPATVWSVAAILVIAGVAYWLFVGFGCWFAWLVPAGIQIPAALAWSVIHHTRRLQQEIKVRDQRDALARGLGTPGAELPPRTGEAAPVSAPALPPRVRSMAPTVTPARDHPAVPDHALLRRIGAGAYGDVWLARDIIGTYHAVKVVYRENFRGPTPYEREFNGIRRFTPISRSHPAFVNILHVGRNEKPEYIYYVMEAADDQTTGAQIDPDRYAPRTLASDLEKHKRLGLAECLSLVIQLADGLHCLHQQQLIHRDIKPANIIFVKGVPKLADIGLVTDVATEGREVTYLGTQGYIPPEGPGTAAGDVYSLGKVLYEIAFGLPVERYPEVPATLVEQASGEELFLLNKIILKTCQDNVDKRFHSAAQLHAELIQLQAQLRPASNP